MRRFVFGSTLAALGLALLLLWSAEAAEGVRHGLGICAEVIIPSLFPFFVLGSSIMELGIPQRASRALSGVMSRLFGVPGAGAAAFLMGVMGGYPLGAAAAADMCERGVISREECSHLLGFCNNSGPAFLVGAAGAGVFGSVRAGLVLYACHVLAALTSGVIMRGRAVGVPSTTGAVPEVLPGALARAVTASVWNILKVCGFVVLFSALVAALDASGMLSRISGELSVHTGLELGAARALATGFFEIGGRISALRSCSHTCANFALCALIIGWGGLSVHMQTAAATVAVKPSAARLTAGRLLSAALSAAYAYCTYFLAF